MDSDEISWLADRGYIFDRMLFASSDTVVGLFKADGRFSPSDWPSPIGRLWAIKRRQGCYPCMVYEAQVGREFYRAAGGDLVGEPGPLFTDPERNRHYLVQEYQPGQSLNKVMDLVVDLLYGPIGQDQSVDSVGYVRSNQDLDLLVTLLRRMVAMLWVIYDLEQRTGFTHYDLHYGNIITNDNLETFKLIDFGVSHFPGVTGWIDISNSALVIGAIPSVSDPWFDLVRLVILFYRYTGYSVPGEIHDLLLRNKFSPSVDPNTRPSWLTHRVQTYPGSELIRGIEIIDHVPPTMWRRDRGGFWIGQGDTVDCQRYARIHPGVFRVATDTSKMVFGDVLSCLKRRNLESRPDPDPRILLELFENDVGRIIASLTNEV